MVNDSVRERVQKYAPDLDDLKCLVNDRVDQAG